MPDHRIVLTDCQLRMARAAARCSVDQLAKASGVASNTIRRLEKDKRSGGVTLALLDRLQTALEAMGVTFLPDRNDGRGPGLRFKRMKQDSNPTVTYDDTD